MVLVGIEPGADQGVGAGIGLTLQQFQHFDQQTCFCRVEAAEFAGVGSQCRQSGV